MRRRADRPRGRRLRRTRLALVLAALVAGGGDAAAQGVSFGAPRRVPRAHDTAIGLGGAGDPALDYTLHCRGCHQASGAGLPGAVPQLAGFVARFAAVPGGREYLGRVPGVAQAPLDDAALAALLNWLLVAFDAEHMPPDFRPFTAEELASLRRRPLVAASAARAALLARITDAEAPGVDADPTAPY